MKFIIGYAGIPNEIYDQVYRKRDSIVRQNGEFIGKPMKSGITTYQKAYANYFLETFHERIAADNHNSLGDSAFLVVCINHNVQNTEQFMQFFFPSTFVVSVNWSLTHGSKMVIAQSGNELINLLTKVTLEAKKYLEVLKKELNERANKTPLLLPIKNFNSKYFITHLIQLQINLPLCDEDYSETVRKHVNEIHRTHPIADDGKKTQSFYTDERGIIFRTPGRARHAFARPQSFGHATTCLLSGHRRLGAPFDPAFHYDCTKGKGNLRGYFFGCHEDSQEKEGYPHLNIAPNDFVRS